MMNEEYVKKRISEIAEEIDGAERYSPESIDALKELLTSLIRDINTHFGTLKNDYRDKSGLTSLENRTFLSEIYKDDDSEIEHRTTDAEIPANAAKNDLADLEEILSSSLAAMTGLPDPDVLFRQFTQWTEFAMKEGLISLEYELEEAPSFYTDILLNFIATTELMNVFPELKKHFMEEHKRREDFRRFSERAVKYIIEGKPEFLKNTSGFAPSRPLSAPVEPFEPAETAEAENLTDQLALMLNSASLYLYLNNIGFTNNPEFLMNDFDAPASFASVWTTMILRFNNKPDFLNYALATLFDRHKKQLLLGRDLLALGFSRLLLVPSALLNKNFKTAWNEISRTDSSPERRKEIIFRFLCGDCSMVPEGNLEDLEKRYEDYCSELDALKQKWTAGINRLQQKLQEQKRKLVPDNRFLGSLLSPEKREEAFFRLVHYQEKSLHKEEELIADRKKFLASELSRIIKECGLSRCDTSNLSREDILTSAIELYPLQSDELQKIIMNLEDSNPLLAEELKKRMFVFDDIVMLTDRDIQKVLREIDSTELGKALKGSEIGTREKIFRNMSKRAAEMVKEDMEYFGPLQKSQVKEAQNHIIEIIRRLEDAGEIVIALGVEDEIVF